MAVCLLLAICLSIAGSLFVAVCFFVAGSLFVANSLFIGPGSHVWSVFVFVCFLSLKLSQALLYSI